MAKGKKFTAAEKYFIERETRYRKEIKQLEVALAESHSTIENLKKENAKLDEELIKTTVERNEALKLSNLSVEELQKHIKSTQNVSQACSLLTFMSQHI